MNVLAAIRRHRDRDDRDDVRTAVVLTRLEMVTERFEHAAERFEDALDQMEAQQ